MQSAKGLYCDFNGHLYNDFEYNNIINKEYNRIKMSMMLLH